MVMGTPIKRVGPYISIFTQIKKMSKTTVFLSLYKPDGPMGMRTPGHVQLLVVNTP